MKIDKIYDKNMRRIDTSVYIVRGKSKYLKYIECEITQQEDKQIKKKCPICLEEHTLQAHHVVPRRLRKVLKNKDLRELRFMICSDCHREIHLENYLMKMLIKLSVMLKQAYGDDIEYVDTYKEAIDIIKKYDGVKQ